ncbi:MAG: gliding motility-associated ABC transporter ATP-binding subunit GldA [Bacteroidetes bacterium RBG_13_43_22]|nr:MAG: gliding motility-associated ABC transporter ATP-binding subunit GldA [Bacteroidetes bacterium RBG_13_43_22]
MSIVVQGVTKLYGEQKALDNVSFEVKTGEIVAFLGPNGAGKTTMMRIITGFIPATSGNVLVNGIEASENNPEIKRNIGYLPENNPLYPEMYVREYLGFVASLYKSGNSVKKQIDNVIEITGLAREQKKRIGSLSKGYRQRVGLAQALIHNPGVLILDEATSGLDPNQIIEIRNLIKDAGKEKTILLSTHIMQEVEAICNRVIIIDKGVIVIDEKKSDIYSIIKRQRQIIHVEFDKNPDEQQLKRIKNVVRIKQVRQGLWFIEAEGEEDIRPLLFAFAVDSKLTVLSLKKEESNLEEIFRHLTGG